MQVGSIVSNYYNAQFVRKDKMCISSLTNARRPKTKTKRHLLGGNGTIFVLLAEYNLILLDFLYPRIRQDVHAVARKLLLGVNREGFVVRIQDVASGLDDMD